MYSLFTGPLRPVFSFLVTWLFFILGSSNAFAQTVNTTLPVISLQIKQTPLQAEVAQTESERASGLMFRTKLAKDSGMLFVFDQPAPMCFWMKNTPLPLSIAFITEQGVISNIANMQPFSTESHCPVMAIKYALEMEQGWFAQQGIQAGDQVESLPN